MKNVLLGKTGPGFVYNIRETQTTPQVPAWSFGNDKRKPLDNGEKYEFYHIQDKFSRPEAGLDFCGPSQRKMKFSRAQRVSKLTPVRKGLVNQTIHAGAQILPQNEPNEGQANPVHVRFPAKQQSQRKFGPLQLDQGNCGSGDVLPESSGFQVKLTESVEKGAGHSFWAGSAVPEQSRQGEQEPILRALLESGQANRLQEKD